MESDPWVILQNSIDLGPTIVLRNSRGHQWVDLSTLQVVLMLDRPLLQKTLQQEEMIHPILTIQTKIETCVSQNLMQEQKKQVDFSIVYMPPMHQTPLAVSIA